MPTRPTQGGSPGTWGTELEANLAVSIDRVTGQLVPAQVQAAFGGSQPDIVIVGADTNCTANILTPGLSFTATGDPATVVQAAINSLKPTGGLILFRGKMTFTTGVTMYPGIGLVGQAPLSQGTQTPSLIVGTNAITGPIITIVQDVGTGWQSFPYFANFALKGSGAGNTGQDGIYCNDANVLDVILDRVLMFDIGGTGWPQGAGATGLKAFLDDCYFERCRQNGVRSEKGTCQVRNSYIQNNTLFGIDATSSSYLEAASNYIWDNAGGGVILWSMTSGASVHDNNFNNNGDNTHPAIALKSLTTATTRAVIHDNVMIDTRVSGSACNFFIQATLGVNANIQSNTFKGQKSGNDPVSITPNASDSLSIGGNAGYNDTKGTTTSPVDTANNRLGAAGTSTTATGVNALNSATMNCGSTTGFPASGNALLAGVVFTYTGVTGTSFTGCGNHAATVGGEAIAPCPVASTDYTISHVEQYLVIAGGTAVSITIKDPAGATVRSGLTTLNERLPVGYKLNLGAFTGTPPTLASSVV